MASPSIQRDAGIRPDPFTLDARLAAAVETLGTSEPRIGRSLRVLVDHKLYRSFSCRSVEEYVRTRLGISARKAWDLLKVERRARPIAPLLESYESGRLSWVRTLTLLPVVYRETAAAWVARATAVTVRRLVDEVNWVLEGRDVLGPDASLDPPPPDAPLAAAVAVTPAGSDCRETAPGDRLQIDVHSTATNAAAPAPPEGRKTSLGIRVDEVMDAEIAFLAPASVVALLRDTMDAYAVDGEPRWTALDRMLRHVVTYWESLPRHRDPIFARDGWRCTVPACSARRNLHDHHVQFRSRGGGNARDNRTTVCAAHHLHGIHDGTVRASGTAPDAIIWELGVRSGAAPPLLRYRGDTRLNTGDSGAARAPVASR
jgi:hypothetical protein